MRLILAMLLILLLWGCSYDEELPTGPDAPDVAPAVVTRGTTAELPEVTGETCGDESTVLLKAAKHIDAGVITVGNTETSLYITVTTAGRWGFTETHLHIGETLDDFPLNKPGNPKVGHFAYKHDGDAASTIDYRFELTDLGVKVGETVLISFHAEVEMEEEGELMVDSESAWSEGTSFPGRSWAMYFSYDVQECIIEE